MILSYTLILYPYHSFKRIQYLLIPTYNVLFFLIGLHSETFFVESCDDNSVVADFLGNPVIIVTVGLGIVL